MQFSKMPQGFKNSPAMFQRAMNYVFKDLIGKICFVYIDDVLVFGETETDHDKNFKLVSDRLKKYNLKENMSKRIEEVKMIKFIGFDK